VLHYARSFNILSGERKFTARWGVKQFFITRTGLELCYTLKVIWETTCGNRKGRKLAGRVEHKSGDIYESSAGMTWTDFTLFSLIKPAYRTWTLYTGPVSIHSFLTVTSESTPPRTPIWFYSLFFLSLYNFPFWIKTLCKDNYILLPRTTYPICKIFYSRDAILRLEGPYQLAVSTNVSVNQEDFSLLIRTISYFFQFAIPLS
jgi:hypothetical protein